MLGTKRRATWVLRKVPGETSYRALENSPDGETYPGLLIVRFDGSLFFANAPDFADEIRTGLSLTEPKPTVVLVDADANAITCFPSASRAHHVAGCLLSAGNAGAACWRIG